MDSSIVPVDRSLGIPVYVQASVVGQCLRKTEPRLFIRPTLEIIEIEKEIMDYQKYQEQNQELEQQEPYSSSVEALRTTLNYFCMDRAEEVTIEQWKTYVQESSLQAKIILKDLDAVISNPPPNLPQILEDDGWIYLYHYEDEAVPRPYSFSEHVEWLKQMRARWHRIYEEEHFSPAGVLRTILPQLWLDNTEYGAEAEWQRIVKQSPRQAKFILEKLTALTREPPPDLPQILRKYGWIRLFHDGNGSEPREYSFSDYVEWVRQMTAQFYCIYEKEQCPSAASGLVKSGLVKSGRNGRFARSPSRSRSAPVC
jgi:hypothetical protein